MMNCFESEARGEGAVKSASDIFCAGLPPWRTRKRWVACRQMEIVERGLDLFLRQEDVELSTQRNIVAVTLSHLLKMLPRRLY